MNLFKSKFTFSITMAICLLAASLTGCDTETNSPESGGTTDTTKTCKAGEKLVDKECKPIDCASDASVCPNGTLCNALKVCEIIQSCESATDCNTRICSNGACLNPKRCTGDKQCLAGDMCDLTSFTCKPSVCPNGCKTGGTCNQATRQCEDATTCTPGNERVACTRGKSCVVQPGTSDGTCMTHAEYEASNPCVAGGVVDSNAFTCVDAEPCVGNTQCTKGKVCVSGSCVKSKCRNSTDCASTGGGVCDPLTGACVNKENCTDDGDCLNGSTCVYSKGATSGECHENVPDADWCATVGAPCPGRQVCTGIDSTTHLPACEEPVTCSSTLDCQNNKRCFLDASSTPSEMKCQTPDTSAVPPVVPNCDDTDDKDISGAEAIDESTEYDLCSDGASSYYKVPLKLGTGEVNVDLNLLTEDIGAGSLKIELFSLRDTSAVTPLASKTLAKGESQASLSYTFPYYNNDAYMLLKVTVVETLPGGLHYYLKGSFTSDIGAGDSCRNAKDLVMGKAATGDTRNTALSALKDCRDGLGDTPEDVWHFSLTQLSKVNIFVSPPPGEEFQPVVSLRKGSCFAAPSLCEYKSSAQAVEISDQVLEPGDYFVVVSSNGADHAGEYSIVVTSSDVECTEGESKCDGADDQYIIFCDSNGQWPTSVPTSDSIDCGAANTCDPAKKACNDVGSSCQNPVIVDDADFNAGVATKSLTFTNSGVSRFNDFPHECNKYDYDEYYGGERVYQISVPAHTKLTATLIDNESGGSTIDALLMILTGCPNNHGRLPDEYCGKGSDDGSTDEGPVSYTNNSDKAKVYYVLADFYTASLSIDYSKANFTLKLEKTALPATSSCQDGDLKCDDTTKEMKVCKSATYEVAYTCTNGCKANTLKPECNDRTPGDTCDDPVILTSGTPTSTYNIGESHDYTAVPSSCTGLMGTPTGGREVVLKYTASADEVAILSVEHVGFKPLIWLADSCDSTKPKEVGACTKASESATGKGTSAAPVTTEFKFFASSGKTYYIVVEPSDDSAGQLDANANFTATLTTTPQNPCTPDTLLSCDGNTLKYCSSEGVEEEYDCAARGSFNCESTPAIRCESSDPALTPQPADTCFDAGVINTTSSSGIITGTFEELNITSHPTTSHNTFEPHGKVGECYFRSDSISSTDGGDRVYAISVPSDSQLSVTLSMEHNVTNEPVAPGSQEASFAHLYFLKNCLQSNSCVGSKQAGPQTIYYRTGATDETIYIVLDSIDVNPGSSPQLLNYNWKLEWNLETSPTNDCVPNQTTCDSNEVVACTPDGQLSGISYQCLAGESCEGGVCVVTGDDVATCDNPLSLDSLKDSTQELHYYFSWDPNESDAGSQHVLCGSKGKTIFYEVNATAGQWIDVDASAADIDDIRVAISTECGGDTCLDSTTAERRLSPVSTSYLVPSDGTYYISISSEIYNGELSPRYGKIVLRNAECVANSANPPTCSGANVTYCKDGRSDSYTCSTGACADGQCQSGDGDVCFNAVPLTTSSGMNQGSKVDQTFVGLNGSTSIKTEYSSANAELSGNCVFHHGNSKDATNKPEKFYSVQLAAGDNLHVDVTLKSSETFYLYLLKSCADQRCVADDFGNIDVSKSGERIRSLDYKAKEAGNYMVVVKLAGDVNSSRPDDYKFDINWKVTPEASVTECTPFVSTCTSDTDISVCNADKHPAKGTCLGTCSDSVCRLDETGVKDLDTCETAPTISKTGLYLLPFNKLENTIKNNFIYNGKKFSFGGRDANFKVSLKPYQSIRVYYRIPNQTKGYKFLRYEDCSSIVSSVTYFNENVVLDYGHPSTEYVKAYEYAASDTAEEFYIAVGSANSDASPIRLFVEIVSQGCDPADQAASMSCSGSGELQYCTKYGSYDTHMCSSGTCNASGKACDSPTGDSCLEAIPLTATSTEQLITANFSGKHNTYSLPQNNMCTKSTAEGNDVVYSIQLSAGQVLTATLVGSAGTDGSTDLALYATDSCVTLPTSCLAGVDEKGPYVGSVAFDPDTTTSVETLSYTATKDQTIFLIVDSYWKNLSGKYTLKYKVQ